MYKYAYDIEFEWDEAKNQANRRKHRVDFEIAQRIFDGYVLTWIDMRRDYGETRAGAIGRTEGMTLAVIFTRRRHRIRLISARKANRNERTIYEARLEALEQG